MRAKAIRAALVVICVSAASAGAQVPAAAAASAALPPTSSTVVCDMNAVTPPAYLPCGLWMQYGRVRRGTSGDELGRPHGWAPISLTELVRGDSAKVYAQKYEDYTWVSSVFKGLGLSAIVAAATVGRAPGCEWPPCSWKRTNTAKNLLVGGLVTFSVSVPFADMARDASLRALWWNNARLGR